MGNVNQPCEPPNINELLPIQTDLSHIYKEIFNFHIKCLDIAVSEIYQTSNENSSIQIYISNKWIQIIKKVKEQHERIQTFIQSLEDKSDIRQTAEKILLNLDETLKEADKAEKIFEEAWSVTELDISEQINIVISNLEKMNEIIGTNIQNLLNSACSSFKKIIRLNNLSPLYKSTTKQKTFVLMIANSTFTNNNTNLGGIKEDVRMIDEYFNSKKDIFCLEQHEDKNKEDTDVIMEQLRLKDFSEYSSIILIFTSHGTKDEVCTTDGSISVGRLWQWWEDNPTTCNLPLVVIVETRTSEVKRQTQNKGQTQSKEVTTSHPNMQDMLIVYATAYGGEAHIGYKGSKFLKEFLSFLDDINKKHWDILAQITEVSKTVLETTDDETKTVNFISLLTSQLKLGTNNETVHDWNKVAAYQLQGQMRALFLVHNTMETEATTLKDAMQAAGIQVIKTTLPYVPTSLFQHVSEISNPSVLFVVMMGLADSNEIHNKHMPKFRAEMSHTNCSALKGIPKVVFFLGSPPLSGKSASLPTVSGILVDEGHNSYSSLPLNNVSENSDVLAYCDFAPGWLESMQEILMAAPGNEEGLVRLLTTRGMARPKALLSDSPPYIESSLRYKLVLPIPE